MSSAISTSPQLLVSSGPDLPDCNSVEQRLFFSAETHVVDLCSAASLTPMRNYSSPNTMLEPGTLGPGTAVSDVSDKMQT